MFRCCWLCRVAPQDTFTRAQHWVKELQLQGNPNIVICLAGNKVDLEEHRAVDKEVRVCVRWGGVGWGVLKDDVR